MLASASTCRLQIIFNLLNWMSFLMSVQNLFQSAISCSISFSFSSKPRISSFRVANIFFVSAKFSLTSCNSVIFFRIFSNNSVNRLKFLGRISSVCLANISHFCQISHLETLKIQRASSISKHVGINKGEHTNSFTHRFLSPHPWLDGPTVKDCILTQRFNSLSLPVDLQSSFDATISF